jgi:hypothetical protein
MSELPAGGWPIDEYRQLRQAVLEQQVNEEFDAAQASYQGRREVGTIRYVSHEEAGRWICGGCGPVGTASFYMIEGTTGSPDRSRRPSAVAMAW